MGKGVLGVWGGWVIPPILQEVMFLSCSGVIVVCIWPRDRDGAVTIPATSEEVSHVGTSRTYSLDCVNQSLCMVINHETWGDQADSSRDASQDVQFCAVTV